MSAVMRIFPPNLREVSIMAVADVQVVEQRKASLSADEDIGMPYETFMVQQGLRSVSSLSPSPLLAAGWAQAVAGCCDAWWSMGAIDSDHPIVVVDLIGDDGHFAHLMWQALERMWNKVSVRDYRLHYVACVPSGTDVDAWREDAGLMDAQNLSVVALDPIDGDRWWVRAGLDIVNPVVVIAHDYLHRLSCSLRGVHYGQWMEGRVHLRPQQETQAAEYRWTVLDKDRSLSETLKQRYLRVIQSACVQVPSQALRLLDGVATLSRSRFLWLAADHGVVEESRIRLGALAPWHQAYEGNQPQPVNFHALAWEPSVHGAWVHHHQPSEGDVVTQAIWRHGNTPLPDSTTSVLRDVLNAAHPALALTCAQLAHALPADTEPSPYLALLKASAHDVRVLEAVLARWCESPPSISPLERGNWREALWRTWEHCPRTSSQGALRHALGLLATHWGFFDLAKHIFQADANHACIAYCNACTGYTALAREQLDEVDPDDAWAIAFREELDSRLDHWRTLAWYRPDLARDGDLCIEPLGHEHAESFLRQYHDPQIAMLTRLPELGSVEQVCDWMAEQSSDPRRSTYAVMTASDGLVGVVSLHAGSHGGYFYFWIGNEYQGRGFGRRLAKLLFRQASTRHVEQIFTSVYADNLRSIDALSAVGFHRLRIRARRPDEDLIFFARVPQECDGESMETVSQRLAELLVELDSSIILEGHSA